MSTPARSHVEGFTDADLKRLEEHFEIHTEGSEPCPVEDSDLMKALIARLRAAEAVIATEPTWIGRGRVARDKWLISKGVNPNGK